jgi:hypothetical protein
MKKHVKTVRPPRSGTYATIHGDGTLEAGTHSPWMSRLLSGLGHEVLVAIRGSCG